MCLMKIIVDYLRKNINGIRIYHTTSSQHATVYRMTGNAPLLFVGLSWYYDDKFDRKPYQETFVSITLIIMESCRSGH